MDARAVGDVLVDRLGERIRLLEHHADAGAQLHHVQRGVVDVLPVDDDLAGDAAALDRVVHAVDAAQEGRLAAARRPDQAVTARSGMSRRRLQRLLVAVVDVDVLGDDLGSVAAACACVRLMHISGSAS